MSTIRVAAAVRVPVIEKAVLMRDPHEITTDFVLEFRTRREQVVAKGNRYRYYESSLAE